MSFYSIYRIVKDITRTIFGYKFWRKLLIIILVAFGLWFFLHNQGYCVEETEDINYSMYSYYDNLTNEAITKIARYYLRDSNNWLFNAIKNNNASYGFYFYYGAIDGSDYLGSTPFNNNTINLFVYNNNTNFVKTITSFDYLGITGKSIYKFNNSNNSSMDIRKFVGDNTLEISTTNFVYMPVALYNYKTTNWLKFEDYIRNGDISSVVHLLEEIKSETEDINENLTSTDYDDTVVSVSNDTIDNMANSTDGMFTTIFTNFNNAVSGGVSQLEIPLPHTEQKLIITSDIVSSHLGGLTYLVQAFWMYVFGLYTWRFVNNLIHRIKDGSILDGFKTDGEVITNTML